MANTLNARINGMLFEDVRLMPTTVKLIMLISVIIANWSIIGAIRYPRAFFFISRAADRNISGK